MIEMRLFALVLLSLCVAGVAVAGQAPVSVSPGDLSALAVIEDRCPTFSWGEVPRAKRYELVVYRAGRDTGAEESGVEETAKLVFRKTLPGPVESWTPSLERCLTAGGHYAWSVRALRREGLSDWSEMRLFRVAAGPSHADFEEALEVVRRYLDRGGKAIASYGAAAENSLVPEAESTGSGAEPAAAAVGTTQLSVDGGVVATSFTGDGSTLTNLNPANLSAPVALNKGGTGATDAAAARANLGAAAAGQACPVNSCVIGIDAAGALLCGACNPLVCGDGTVQLNEECDDGNTQNGDGCSATCLIEPPLEVVSASATNQNLVEVIFNHSIEPSSVLGDGSQFTFDLGLTATAADVSGSTVFVGTTSQAIGTSYTVTVASSVTDTQEVGVSPSANSAVFAGYAPPASVLINELNGNVSGGCDLVELRAVTAGTMDGFYLKERSVTVVVTFSGLIVQAGDFVVVHFDTNDANCNPASSGNETSAKDEYPNSTHAKNYDAAWDWYSTDTGITATDNVITLYDDSDTIIDAVFVSDDATGTAASATETQAAEVAAAGEWEQIGGGIPAGGFVDDDFNKNAVLDLNGTGTDASGESIQRSDDSDANTKLGWTMAASSWGALNTGQTP